MITSVRLQNFKAHRDTTVPLGRLTVLVGPNGAGKTSVLQGLQVVGALTRENASDIFSESMRGADIVCRASPRGPIRLDVEGTADHTPWRAAVELSPVNLAAAAEPEELVWQPTLSWSLAEQSGRLDPPDSFGGRFAELRHTMGAVVLFRFDARRIAAPAYSDVTKPSVEHDGSNTAVVLAALKLDQDEIFERIQSDLRRVVPNVERVRVPRAKVVTRRTHTIMGHQILLDFRGAPNVPAHAASEGTLVTLALLTAIHAPQRPSLILLDDVDQSLHPQAQIELVRQLRRLLDELPDVQIVATTHSPYVLDELDPADVQVFALRDDGSVAVKRLSEHPEAERMKRALTTGQLWSLDAEKAWVTGDRA